MKHNIIFDYGNVLVHFDPHDLCAAVLQNETDIALVKDVLFDRASGDRLDAGTISDEEVVARSLERIPERLHDAARRIYAEWYRNTPYIEGLDALVSRLKAEGRGLYLLSNISKGFAAHRHEAPHVEALLSKFDGLVLSGTIGIVKPNAEIFRYLLDTYHLDASDCVFVDDARRNIAGARNVGIEAYLFDGDAAALDKYLHNT